jgi:hypothetical protein
LFFKKISMPKKEDPVKKPGLPVVPGEEKNNSEKDREKEEQDNMGTSHPGKGGNPPPEKEIKPKKDL